MGMRGTTQLEGEEIVAGEEVKRYWRFEGKWKAVGWGSSGHWDGRYGSR